MSGLLLLLFVFPVSMVVAYLLISRIPERLHTPLMSLTNAISAITIVGAVLIFASSMEVWETAVGVLALGAAAFNVVGGFVLTHRILKMFRD